MIAQDHKPRRPLSSTAPKELLGIVGFTLAIFVVVLAGSTIADWIDHRSPWLFAAAYALPSGIAFAIYWLIARRIRP